MQFTSVSGLNNNSELDDPPGEDELDEVEESPKAASGSERRVCQGDNWHLSEAEGGQFTVHVRWPRLTLMTKALLERAARASRLDKEQASKVRELVDLKVLRPVTDDFIMNELRRDTDGQKTRLAVVGAWLGHASRPVLDAVFCNGEKRKKER